MNEVIILVEDEMECLARDMVESGLSEDEMRFAAQQMAILRLSLYSLKRMAVPVSEWPFSQQTKLA